MLTLADFLQSLKNRLLRKINDKSILQKMLQIKKSCCKKWYKLQVYVIRNVDNYKFSCRKCYKIQIYVVKNVMIYTFTLQKVL